MSYYQVFMIDPPWEKRKSGRRAVRPLQTRDFPYRTLSTDEIFNIIRDTIIPMADYVHCIFMWSIDSHLNECEEYMSRLGYRMHCRIIWDKGNGIAPAFTIRFVHEYLLWYYKPKFMPVDYNARGHFISIIREQSRQHSRKLDIAYNLLNALFPGSRKLDVFSREKRIGWDQYGDQQDYFNDNIQDTK